MQIAWLLGVLFVASVLGFIAVVEIAPDPMEPRPEDDPEG
jgi:hypothetical protein